MTMPYALRALCLCLASFFLIHLATGLLVAWLAPVAIRAAGRMRAWRGAAFLLTLRVAPFAAAMLVVIGVCAPSYFLLEPRGMTEDLGYGCMAAAALGAAICAEAMARAGQAVWRLARCRREWHRRGDVTAVSEEFRQSLVLREEAPFMALAGLVRPQIVVSQGALDALSPDELATAVRHEQAHRKSFDNLKRLLLLLLPDLLPAWPCLHSLDAAWKRLAEWAADDRAAEGSPEDSVCLAAALVRVARMSSVMAPSALITPLLADSEELTERVDRLLGRVPPASSGRWTLISLPAISAILCAAVVVVTRQPAALSWIHGTLEQLVH